MLERSAGVGGGRCDIASDGKDHSIIDFRSKSKSRNQK